MSVVMNTVPAKKTWARGSPPHVPTKEQRLKCQTLAMVGVPHHDIATLMGISIKTLLKRYKSELATGKAMANAEVGKRLFMQTKNNVAAAIWWSKSQMGWRDTTYLAGDRDNPLAFEAVARTVQTVSTEEAEQAYLRLIAD